MRCSIPGCMLFATRDRDDGMCHKCRHNRRRRVHKDPMPDGSAHPRQKRTYVACRACKTETQARDVVRGLCRPCRSNVPHVPRHHEPCQARDCKWPAELGTRMCLSHRPVFEKILVSPRPSALDYAGRPHDPLDWAKGGG